MKMRLKQKYDMQCELSILLFPNLQNRDAIVKQMNQQLSSPYMLLAILIFKYLTFTNLSCIFNLFKCMQNILDIEMCLMVFLLKKLFIKSFYRFVIK